MIGSAVDGMGNLPGYSDRWHRRSIPAVAQPFIASVAPQPISQRPTAFGRTHFVSQAVENGSWR